MKNLHFCTKAHIDFLNNCNFGDIIETFRTGYVPSIYEKDVINCNIRENKEDSFAQFGLVTWVMPFQYEDIDFSNHLINAIPEIKESYKKRRFHPKHWFFRIIIVICDKEGKYPDRKIQIKKDLLEIHKKGVKRVEQFNKIGGVR